MSDSLRVFPGEKLYDLIDGGADIYLEYGFVRAGVRHYGMAEGGEISIEIHEMRDTLAAWGIYSFLSAETGTPAEFGQEGVEGEDFVIFWKNRFVVLVTATNEKGRSGIARLARDVSQRIRPGGRRPDLAEALLQPEFRNSDVLLMKGALAFDRRAGFGLENVFRLREGISGVIDHCRTFVLRYAEMREARSAELAGVRLLTERGGYTEVSGKLQGRMLSGPQGRLLHMRRDLRYLLVTIGPDEEKVRSTAAALAKAVSMHLKP